MATALVGTVAGERALYYVAVFGLIVVGVLVASHDASAAFYLSSAHCLFSNCRRLVPPDRFGLTVFDVVMLALTIGLIGKRCLHLPLQASLSSRQSPY